MTSEDLGKRRIALIGNAADSTLNFRTPLIADLVAAGCLVEVLAPDWRPEHWGHLARLGAHGGTFPLARTGLNPFEDLRTVAALYQHLRRSRPQTVFTYTAKPNIWGILAAALARVPRRVAMVAGLGFAFTKSPDEPFSLKRTLLRWLLTFLYRLALPLAHIVVVQNPDDGEVLVQTMGVHRARVLQVNGTGVPLGAWPLHPPHLQPLTFTLVARLLREKGVLEFLQAAKQVLARHPAVRFWLLGPLDSNPGGLGENELRPWLQRGTVEWLGAVADVRPWLAQTSVFVLPSYREGVPRSTQEAMAMGRPVITTDVPGCRETVIDGLNGFLVPPRNVPALVAAMERFIAEPSLIATMGRQSRRLAEERFDVRQVNAILMQHLIPGV